MATKVRRAWTEEEMRGALSRLVAAAYGRRDDFPMSIPGQPGDADVLLHDAIDELLALRAKSRERETTSSVLECLDRHYGGQAKVAQRLMNQTADVEVAARHAANALEWEVRRQTVCTVAKNLEIELGPIQAQTTSMDPKPTSSVEDRLRGLIERLPAEVRAWLRTIDWPYQSWPRLSFEQEMVLLKRDEVSGEPRWFSRWKPTSHVTVIVHDTNSTISHQALFRVENNGAWTQILLAGKAQS